MLRILCANLILAIAIYPNVSQAEQVVFWGGDVTSEDMESDRHVTDIQGDFDRDGQADDSMRATYFLDQSQTLSPDSADWSGQSQPYYGGAQVIKHGITSKSGLAKVHLKNAGEQDLLAVYFQRPPDSLGGDAAAAVLWPLSEKANSDRLTLGDVSQFTAVLGPGNSFDEARWLVRIDGRYYLSDATFRGGAGTYTLDEPADVRWLRYAPTREDLRFAPTKNEASPDTDKPLQAVGFYVSKDLSSSRAGSMTVQKFSIQVQP